MAPHTQNTNCGSRRSCRKLIFRSFGGHPEGFGGVETGPVSHLSLLCAAGSGVEQASRRGRGAWVSPITSCTSHEKGQRAHVPQLPSASNCFCLLLAFQVCYHTCERRMCSCSCARTEAFVQGHSCGSLRSGSEWVLWEARPLPVCSVPH